MLVPLFWSQMELHLNITGILLICLGLTHVVFPQYFNWKDELQSLTLINRQVMMVHTFFIALMAVLMGILCLISTEELINTPLGQNVSMGLGIFWFCRLLIQIFGYSQKLWRGKKFETVVHILFTCLWIYLSAIFLLVAI